MNNDGTRTEGEKLFEQYLISQGLPFEFEKVHVGKSRRPDYTIEWNHETVIFDVKDFDRDESAAHFRGAFDPYTRLREKIDQGRDKFKQYKEFCCGLVLCNLGNPFVMLQDTHTMLGAMYGDTGFTFPVNTRTGVGDSSKLKETFLGNGKMIRPHWSKPQNTTISVLITLSGIQPHYLRLVDLIRQDRNREIDDCEAELRRTVPDYDPGLTVPRVIVWHNAVARIPFPDDLFSGPYDSHIGVVQESDGVFQRVTFRGSQLSPSVKF